jgi:hypothetical protein
MAHTFRRHVDRVLDPGIVGATKQLRVDRVTRGSAQDEFGTRRWRACGKLGQKWVMESNVSRRLAVDVNSTLVTVDIAPAQRQRFLRADPA